MYRTTFLLTFILASSYFSSKAQTQTGKGFTDAEIQEVLHSGSGVSGAGKAVKGNGWGGWISGMSGLKIVAPPIDPSVISNGLLPSIKPIWDAHIRDAVICLGGDGNYYLTGSTGDNIWKYTDGVELWRSKDLQHWDYIGLIWNLEKEGTWEKGWRNLHDKPARAIWAPELHFVKNNYYITLSMAPFGAAILKSTTGKPEGPYIHATSSEKPFVEGIDATLFEDDDGKVYFTWSGATKIGLMKEDMSDFAEPLKNITLLNPDHDSTHHSKKCIKRGMNDLGHEGAVLFKANGKYYLGAADEFEGRYSTCIAMSDNVFGPYTTRYETVPCGGGTGFFKDKDGNWWSTFFGNDSQSPWREKPGLVKIVFDQDGKIHVARDQPLFVLTN
jgi:beta-xylosidase